VVNVANQMAGASASWLLNYSLFWMLFAVLLLEIGLVLIALRIAKMGRVKAAPAILL